MAFKKTFVLSDESINTYGFWILLSGMSLSGVQSNCPLYYEHRTWEIPCGHVENIRLKDKQVLGDIVIEGGNDIEKEYIRKIEHGDIKGCSLGIEPVQWSEEPDLIKAGQTRATLSMCTPYEVSLAPLPGNKNALALRNANDMITLSAEKHYDFIPDLNLKPDMKEIAILLNMDANSTAQQLCDAIKPLQLKAANADALQKTIENTVSADLPEKEKTFFLTLSKTNMPAALEFLALNKKEEVETETITKTAAPAVQLKAVKIADLIKPGAQAVELAKDGKDSFDYLQKHNSVELARIKQDEPEKYAKIVADYATGVRFKA